ncbi:MAG: glutamate-5-semialdehyde dehydrogenase [Candidatus Methanomethylophilaceae archaeon]|nr:glutamate-5-semialdehyde dehydrogenase [Candidatus Methanomethylophilaceae archaeon]
MSDVVLEVKRAKEASISMAVLPTSVKNAALEAMASALDSRRAEILEASVRDLEVASAMLSRGEISQSMFKRLKIDDSKIDGMIAGIRDVIGLADPAGEVMSALDLDDGLTLYQIRCPIGMLGVIFESRPDVVPQIMSLCLKSGNSVAFKGGREALESIRSLFSVLRDAASSAGVPKEAFVLMESRSDIDSILGLDGYIDLLIPRGSNSFVQYIQSHTKIPVLGHAAGICHVYVDRVCDMGMAVDVVVDSKTQYPAVCNAAETLLVHSEAAGEFLPKAAVALGSRGVEIRGDERTLKLVPSAVPATDEDWDTEYGDLTISVKVVDSVQEAIAFINLHGSHHTDAILTSDMSSAALFASMVDSADVFVNASTRFADGYRYGKGAEVGISTNKIHSRGPVGMEGLMIYKYVLIGSGQVVKDYVGKDARPFTHVPSDKEYPFRGGRRCPRGRRSWERSGAWS